MYKTLTLSEQKDKSLLVPLTSSLLEKQQIRLFLKRDELLDEAISGNKWRKLKYNLMEAKRLKKTTLLSFGGAFSNHVYAVAAAGKKYNFKTVFLIRGEEPAQYSPTLRFAKQCGAQLYFCSRTDYRDMLFREKFAARFGASALVLPEGGSNDLAIKGCREIVGELKLQMPRLPDFLCVSAGTGATAAGIIAALEGQSRVLVFPALKGNGLEGEIAALLQKHVGKSFSNWQLIQDYHFGGYAKYKPELIAFINDFKNSSGIQLDPVYTGKMLFGVFDLAGKAWFPKGKTIVAIHTGGLQGIAGFNERYGNLIQCS